MQVNFAEFAVKPRPTSADPLPRRHKLSRGWPLGSMNCRHLQRSRTVHGMPRKQPAPTDEPIPAPLNGQFAKTGRTGLLQGFVFLKLRSGGEDRRAASTPDQPMDKTGLLQGFVLLNLRPGGEDTGVLTSTSDFEVDKNLGQNRRFQRPAGVEALLSGPPSRRGSSRRMCECGPRRSELA